MEQSKWHMQLHEGRESALPATLEPVGYVKGVSAEKVRDVCIDIASPLSFPPSYPVAFLSSFPPLSLHFFFFLLSAPSRSRHLPLGLDRNRRQSRNQHIGAEKKGNEATHPVQSDGHAVQE